MEFDHPFMNHGLDGIGEQVTAEERLDEAVGGQRDKHPRVKVSAVWEGHCVLGR
jgi:hypothetical protein